MAAQPPTSRPPEDRMVRSIPHKDGLTQSHSVFKRAIDWKKVIPNRPALARIIVEGSIAFSFAILIGIIGWCILYSYKGRLKQFGPYIKTFAKNNFFLRQIQKEKEAARKKLKEDKELQGLIEQAEEDEEKEEQLKTEALGKFRKLLGKAEEPKETREQENGEEGGEKGDKEEDALAAGEGKKKKRGKKHAMKKQLGKIKKVAEHEAIQKGLGKIKEAAKSKAIQKHVGKIKKVAKSKAIRKHVGKIKKAAKSKAIQKHVGKIKKAAKSKAVKKHIGRIKKVAKSKAIQKHVGKIKKAAKAKGKEMNLIKMLDGPSEVPEKVKKDGKKTLKEKASQKQEQGGMKSQGGSHRKAKHYEEESETELAARNVKRTVNENRPTALHLPKQKEIDG